MPGGLGGGRGVAFYFNSHTCILGRATGQFLFSNYSNTFHSIFMRLCLLRSF